MQRPRAMIIEVGREEEQAATDSAIRLCASFVEQPVHGSII